MARDDAGLAAPLTECVQNAITTCYSLTRDDQMSSRISSMTDGKKPSYPTRSFTKGEHARGHTSSARRRLGARMRH